MSRSPSPPGPARRLVLAALLLAASCGAPPPERVPGYAEAEYVRLGAPEAGWLESVAVARGDRVEAGAALFTLEAGRQRAALAQAVAELARARAQLADLRLGKRPEEIARSEAELAEARANLVYAQRDLQRQERLMRSDVAAEARLDQARAAADAGQAKVDALAADLATARLPARADQIAAAEAAVEAATAALAQAQWQLDQRTVRAPMAALVEDRLRQTGEWAPAGGIVVSLLPPGRVKVRFFVPQRLLGGLHPGQSVEVSCDGCAAPLAARIGFIASEAEFTPPVIYSVGSREKLVFMVEAWPEPADALLAGQPVDVDLRPASGSSGGQG